MLRKQASQGGMTKMQQVKLLKSEHPYYVNEEIKYLRTNLLYSGADNKVIMFTSTMSGEGKSTVAFELAKSLTELDKKVLFVDTDLRKSVMKNKTASKSTASVGLSDYLSGQKELDDVFCATDLPKFFMIFAGHVPPNPSELLAKKTMDSLINWARKIFDYIIIDSAPLGMVIDAAVIAPKCDGAVIVVEADKIPYRVLQNVKHQLQRVKCPILGAVINKVKVRGNNKYYNRYYNHYAE